MSTESCSWTLGTGPSAPPASRDERVVQVGFAQQRIEVTLADGRLIAVPLAWYPRLYFATPAQRADWRPVGEGVGIHFPQIDEDISVDDLLRGGPAPRHAHLIRTGFEQAPPATP